MINRPLRECVSVTLVASLLVFNHLHCQCKDKLSPLEMEQMLQNQWHQWHADGGYMNLHVHQHVGNIVHLHVHHHVPRHSTSACSSATISPNSLTTSAIPWETSIAYTSKTWSKLSPKIWGGKCPGGKCSKIKNLCLDTF